MEIHAHSHTARKKWTHYFWEFLMLFLAVTLGFFVENQREHYIEKKRERQFMQSILQDLKTDTLIFSEIIEKYSESNKMIDTLISLLKSPDRERSTARIYFLAKTIPLYDMGLSSSNKTYEQMKSSGNLRLIHDISMLDTLGYYYFSLSGPLLGPIQMQFENRHDLYLFYNKLFDAGVFQQMIQSSEEIVSMPSGNPPLLANNQDVINEVCMRYHNIHFTKKVLSQHAIERKNFASYLIVKIQKEYHFN